MTALRKSNSSAFTLIELLVVIAIIALLISILIPTLSRARESAKTAVCLSNQRQIAMAAKLYMDNHGGKMFHHHEGWVLDDGSQMAHLPADVGGCEGGGYGSSEAEKPWVIFLQPYMNSRKSGFCPSDPTEKSPKLSTRLFEYNGNIASTEQEPPQDSELSIALANRLTMVSYVLNSIFTHRSCRYAKEGALDGFLSDSRVSALKNPNVIMFSERNSEAMNAEDNEAFGSVGQDDYDSWVGEPALVQWGAEAGTYASQGWIRYNRHGDSANYIYVDGHAERARWSQIRRDQFPDGVVRRPLEHPPR